jgi:hypothetical protein
MSSREKGPPGKDSSYIKVYVSEAIVQRLKSYASAISGKRGSVSTIVGQWIIEKLPEAEDNLVPRRGRGSPPAAKTGTEA